MEAFAGAPMWSRLCAWERAVLCGRADAYGLAAAGEAGVNRAIEILSTDLGRTLRLLGCPSTTALDRSYGNVPKSWEAGSWQSHRS
jgi:L-lactate dehydrogenase (cytochrome)